MSAPLLADLLAISRAYSIPYVSLAGLAAMVRGPTAPPASALLLDLALPSLLTIGLAALNDAQHARADARAGRGRAYSPALLLACGAGGTAGALALAARGGPAALAGTIGTILCGLLYARVKDRPGAGNVVRGLTSVPLVLGLGALNRAGWAALPVALGVAALDAAGNIWGDERDVDYDRRAGVRTLALAAPRVARLAAVALHAMAIQTLSRQAGAGLWLSLAGSGYVLGCQGRWRHRAFLMLKYATVGWVALAGASTGCSQALALTLSLGALPARRLYTTIHQSERKPNAHHR